MSENNCVICFKTVKIYSIGECDHPVCYECSTRMRVICKQNECPICRHILEQVIFVERVRPFRDCMKNYRLYESKYNIAFQNSYIQDSYNSLLHYVCKKCRCEPVFQSDRILNEHMKKEHDLYCCDICVSHLKIFPEERRYYTKNDLRKHNRSGDVDDRSYRGHPVCKFCNDRYLDRDELYKHLRKAHFFCYICDLQGIQQFYGSYQPLREHYKKEHYLCEEGACLREELPTVFATEIDLKAHFASVHCKNLRDKRAMKQARTIDLEFNLVPRDRFQDTNFETAEASSRRELPMASWNEAFPSLGDVASTYARSKSKFARAPNNKLEITNENFPPLGSEMNVYTDTRPSSSGCEALLNRKPSLSNSTTPTSSERSLSSMTKKSEERKHEIQKPPQSSVDRQSKPQLYNRQHFPELQNAAVNSSGAAKELPKNKMKSVSVRNDADTARKITRNGSRGNNTKTKTKKFQAFAL